MSFSFLVNIHYENLQKKKAELSYNAHVVCHEHNINIQNLMCNVYLINHIYQSQEFLKCR